MVRCLCIVGSSVYKKSAFECGVPIKLCILRASFAKVFIFTASQTRRRSSSLVTLVRTRKRIALALVLVLNAHLHPLVLRRLVFDFLVDQDQSHRLHISTINHSCLFELLFLTCLTLNGLHRKAPRRWCMHHGIRAASLPN